MGHPYFLAEFQCRDVTNSAGLGCCHQQKAVWAACRAMPWRSLCCWLCSQATLDAVFAEMRTWQQGLVDLAACFRGPDRCVTSAVLSQLDMAGDVTSRWILLLFVVKCWIKWIWLHYFLLRWTDKTSKRKTLQCSKHTGSWHRDIKRLSSPQFNTEVYGDLF